MSNKLEGQDNKIIDPQLVGAGDNANSQGKNLNAQGEKDPELFTAEQLEKKLQSETDKRVTEALKTAKAKWEDEYKVKLETEKKQAQKLASLSAEQKEAELLKMKEEEIAARESKLQRRELELEATKILADEDLPVKFVDMLIGEDAETTQANIKQFKDEWTKAIEEEMKNRVNNSTFKRSTPGKSASIATQLAKESKNKTLDHNWF